MHTSSALAVLLCSLHSSRLLITYKKSGLLFVTFFLDMTKLKVKLSVFVLVKLVL